MQFPPVPPGVADINYLIHQMSPFVGLLLMFMGVRWLLRSPVGEALAERIRHRSQRRWGAVGEDPQRVAALEEQVAQLQGKVSELAECCVIAECRMTEQRRTT